jgi:hypothetical protein
MIINYPKLEKVNRNIRINFSIEAAEKFSDVLWYEISDEYRSFISESCDAALIALLMPAMYENENIHINGTVSEKLVFNIYRIQKVLQILVPSLHIINVTYKKTTAIKHYGKGVFSGFSAGIDAYTTLDDYFYNCSLESHKITHLGFHNVGGHVIGDYNTDYTLQYNLFEKRLKKIKRIASKLKIPLIATNSNLDQFYLDKDLNIEQTYPLRNVSVALLLQKGFKNYYSSSGYPYDYVEIKKYSSATKVDPILLPMFSTESIDVMLVGAEYSRIQKTLKVAKIADAHTTLDVCTNSCDGINCSKCYKCLRTQFTLDLAGKLKNFSSVFDLRVYEQEKETYMQKIALNICPPYSTSFVEYLKFLDDTDMIVDLKEMLQVNTDNNILLQDECFDLKKILKKAMYCHYKKDLKNAIRLYQLILFIDPNHSAAEQYLVTLEQFNRV